MFYTPWEKREVEFKLTKFKVIINFLKTFKLLEMFILIFVQYKADDLLNIKYLFFQNNVVSWILKRYMSIFLSRRASSLNRQIATHMLISNAMGSFTLRSIQTDYESQF